jgi:hypothetical protein
MKRAITATGLATLAVMAVLGVFSVGSASASNQTLYLFLYSGPLPGLILFLSTGNQVFVPQAGGEFSIVCEHFGGHGTITTAAGTMWGTTQKVTGKYSKCKATPLGQAATVSEAEYEVDAQGSLRLLKDISVEIKSLSCVLTVKASTNQHLLLLLFLLDPVGLTLHGLLIHAEVSKLHSEASSEAACGVTGGKLQTTGTYAGLILAWVHNGNLLWDR